MSVLSQIVLIYVLKMHCVVVCASVHTVYALCVYMWYMYVYIYIVW